MALLYISGLLQYILQCQGQTEQLVGNPFKADSQNSLGRTQGHGTLC